MKSERCLLEKFILSITRISIIFVGIICLTGFCDPVNNYIKLEDITVELGKKIPQDKINTINNYLINSNLVLEDSVPKDIDGYTIKTGTFNYYIIDRDEERKYSRLTKNSATISVIDTVKPEIRIKNTSLKFNYGSKINVNDIASCYDLSNCNISFKSNINTQKEGKQEITIVAIDESNNISEVKVNITIKNKPNYFSYSYVLMENQNKTLNSSLNENDKINLRNQVVAYAKQFEGNPYVYGGNSLTNGIDCSGFTKEIYSHFGYKLPRSAPSQYYVGTPVSRSQLLPGDLVLFHRNGAVYHVTLYIGNNQVIHASTAKTGIKISNIWSDGKYYRRIIY